MDTPEKPPRNHRQIAEDGPVAWPAQVPFVQVLNTPETPPMQMQAQRPACSYTLIGSGSKAA